MEIIFESFQGRGILWWIGQSGIALEITGALYIVIAAFKNKKLVKEVAGTWDGLGHLSNVKEAIQGQAITELRGFLLLGIGLVLQLIGGFGF